MKNLIFSILFFSAILLKAETETYCTPTFSNGTPNGLYINSVSFNGLSNLNSGGGAAYHDYTSMGLTIDKYRQDTLIVTLGPTAGYVAAFIDYDGDNLFESSIGNGYVAPNTPFAIPLTIPASCITGTTRLRVVCNHSTGNYLTDCPTIGYGEVEDYSITFNDPYPNSSICLPDFSSDNPGLYIDEVLLNDLHSQNTKGQYYYSFRNETTSIDKYRCDTIYVKLGAIGGYVIAFMDLDADNSFDFATGGDWVSQNTLHKLPFCIPSHTAAQTIRIRILCNKSTGDYLSFCPTLGYGEIEDYNITVIEPYQNNIYCTPSSVSATGRQGYINNVTIGAINNFNTGGQYYYSIRPETSQLAKNTNNTATVKVSSAGQVGLYIDYDQDGDFESAGSIQSANINTMTATIPFTVPASAMLGITRMRVVYGKNSYVSSCPTSSFGGEVEDYYVEIVNSVGVEETTNLTEFSVYPNPAQDGAQLHLKFNTPEQTSVIISNSFGENIQLFCFNEITEINENLKFENLPSGVFFIKVVTEKEVKVLKFVKL